MMIVMKKLLFRYLMVSKVEKELLFVSEPRLMTGIMRKKMCRQIHTILI